MLSENQYTVVTAEAEGVRYCYGEICLTRLERCVVEGALRIRVGKTYGRCHHTVI